MYETHDDDKMIDVHSFHLISNDSGNDVIRADDTDDMNNSIPCVFYS